LRLALPVVPSAAFVTGPRRQGAPS